jgi:Nucleotidyl transferase AbiEii toxin, Type IV TA system
MRFHAEVLSTAQKELLLEVGPILTGEGFYLGGGTALALQLGHRRSVDLDWFTHERMKEPNQLVELLREQEVPFVSKQLAEGTLHGRVRRIRLSLLAYPYPLLQPLVEDPAWPCRLASLADLAAMKLAAVAGRGSKKDFVDLYALGNAGLELGEMLTWYKQKYSVAEFVHLLYSLVYFADADKQPMPPRIWEMNWREIKKVIRQRVEELKD